MEEIGNTTPSAWVNLVGIPMTGLLSLHPMHPQMLVGVPSACAQSLSQEQFPGFKLLSTKFIFGSHFSLKIHLKKLVLT